MLLARLAGWTGLHLQPVSLHVEIEGELGPAIRLCDVPDLRLRLGQFLLDLVEQHQRSWFGQSCGQCGNSCRRPEILLREQEILPIQMHLGVTESQFRQTYLDPAGTWNAGDGLIHATPEGACPFLQGTGPDPNTTFCSIYEIRPRSCREFQSNQSFCRKDPAQLLEDLTDCWVRPDFVTVFRKGGGQHQMATPAQLWQSLGEALSNTPKPADRRVSGVVDALCELLDQEMVKIDLDYDYSKILGRIHAMLRQAASMMQSDEELDQKIELAWDRYRHFQALLCGEVGPTAQPEALPVRQAQSWSRLRLSEEELCIDGSFRLPALTGQAFLETLLGLAHEELQLALRQPDPPCYMCGECCRHFVVEIHPSDITRLSRHLEISAQEFVERYTSPARFGWNLQDRVLNKVAVPTYSKKLLELSLVGEQGDQQCVFLERGQDGLFYCQVHSHKPQVCRGFEPTHSLCRHTNQRENAGRQADRLHWVEITADTVRVETHQGPLLLNRCDYPDLQVAACQLEETVAARFSD